MAFEALGLLPIEDTKDTKKIKSEPAVRYLRFSS